MKVILASQSPRRKELLSRLIRQFDVESADIDETPKSNEFAEEYVARLAYEKSMAIFNKHNDACVIGSDTAVVIEQEILGKPKDIEDSLRMLSLLSEKTHQVMTGFSIVAAGQKHTQVITTDVTFTTLSRESIINYWQTNEPQDKAGSYAIQGIGGKFVEKINGSVSSVIGLPLVEVERALKKIL